MGLTWGYGSALAVEKARSSVMASFIAAGARHAAVARPGHTTAYEHLAIVVPWQSA
jgi:hypothetical protein